MDACELIRLQLELQGIGLDGRGRLARLPGPDPEAIGLAYLFLLADGTVLRHFRWDLDGAYAARARGIPFEEACHGDGLLDLLAGSTRDRFSVYTFPMHLPPPALAPDDGQKTRLELVEGGGVVAFCGSVRENAHAAEAWTFVAEPRRRQCLASRLVQAWAAAVARKGKVPFYTHRAGNEGSQRLAESLGLAKVADVLEILD